ncbi:MAG TPA: alpha/beta hydrolase [Gemmatimonadaceae bacterium]|nr:alpha/beta hydrolase [Gemmatimonadaceae bacterium]
MIRRYRAALLAAALATLAAPPMLHAQDAAASDQSIVVRLRYHGEPDLTYRTVDGWEGKLDLYVPRAPGTHPLFIYFHGGGWEHGRREMIIANLIPYLEMGYAVANVDYRLTKDAPAPAAVEDARCAVRWLAGQAKRYRLDTSRVVLAGESAGAHLALMAGMLRASDGLDGPCASAPEPHIAAIVDWYGITDVRELIDGPNRRHWAADWIGQRPDRAELATKLSPLRYVRPGLPPIIMVHGDSDRAVPYQQSVRLRDALARAGVPTELITIPGGGHADKDFSDAETIHAQRRIEEFLRAHHAWSPPTG